MTRLRLLPLILLTPLAAAANESAITDAMSDEELRAYRKTKIAELRGNRVPAETTPDGTAYARTFFCTVYYTPKESGFTAERGFDATPVKAAGLQGRSYPRAFLQAVKKEGFGHISEAVNGKNYIRWMEGDRYAFAETPLGRRGEVLQPRRSCAISSSNEFLEQHATLIIRSSTVEEELGSGEWVVCDTGGGLHPLQIDLYWGEDEPRGAVGRQQARPAGTEMEYAFEVEVIVPSAKAAEK